MITFDFVNNTRSVGRHVLADDERLVVAADYMHVEGDVGDVRWCSTATDFLHFWQDGSPPSLTGFGFCEHKFDADGYPFCVVVDPP